MKAIVFLSLFLSLLVVSQNSNATVHNIGLSEGWNIIVCNYGNERVFLHRLSLNATEQGISFQLVASTNALYSGIGTRTLSTWPFFSYENSELTRNLPLLVRVIDTDLNTEEDERAITEFINQTLLTKSPNTFSGCATERIHIPSRPH